MRFIGSRHRPAWLSEEEGGSLVGCLGLLDEDKTSLCTGKSVALSIIGDPDVEFELDPAICTFPNLVGTVGVVQRAIIAMVFGWYARLRREPWGLRRRHWIRPFRPHRGRQISATLATALTGPMSS